MASRLRTDLHAILKAICPNVYYQPPSNIALTYPCIVYRMNGDEEFRADNLVYVVYRSYVLTVIDRNPDGVLPDEIRKAFGSASIGPSLVVDGINNTTITLYY